MQNTETPATPPDRRPNVDNRGVLLFGFFLGLTVLVIAGLIGIYVRGLERGSDKTQRPIEPQVAVALRRTPPEPRLEADPLALRRSLNTRENAELSSYGWVDRGAGIVRIPIDKAMAMIAANGVPGGKPIPGPTPVPAAVAAGKR